MGMFDQMKAAGGMLKGMDPGQIKDLMSQAKESQKMMNDHIDKAVAKFPDSSKHFQSMFKE